MSAIFESIFPIFLLVLAGVVLRRWRAIGENFWPGLEQFGYYVSFPALLFLTLYGADFSGLGIASVAASVLVTLGLTAAFILTLWPAMKARGVTASSFTTVFQTGIRWNGFVALAMAEKLYGAEGLALVALVMALIIPPINFACVGVMVYFGSGARNLVAFALGLARNPLILACLAGLAARLLPFELYGPALQAVDLIAATALGLGLLMVGAGLKVGDALKPRPAAGVATAIKLMVFPFLMIAVATAFGVTGETLELLVLCAAVPTAMNGYLLARQMGGDAPLYAAVTTIQTAVSFLTMPAALWAASYISG